MRRPSVLDEDRPAPGDASRLRVDVGVADHPATGEVDVEVGSSLQQHPGLRLPAVARLCELGVDRIGMVQAVAVVVDRDSTSRRAVERRAREPREGPRARPFPSPRLVGSRQRRYGSRVSGYDGSRQLLPGTSRTSSLTFGPSNDSSTGVPDELDDDAVPVEEDGALAHRPSAASTDSHFPGALTSAGCETRRCHTIAWNSSTWGVRRSGGASMTMQTSACFGGGCRPLARRRRRRVRRPPARARSHGPGSPRRCARDCRRPPRTRGSRPVRTGATSGAMRRTSSPSPRRSCAP